MKSTITRTATGAWLVRGGGCKRRRYRTYWLALLEKKRRVGPRINKLLRAGASVRDAFDQEAGE